METIRFLGTCAGTPTASRNVSSYGITFRDGKVFLIDCGEGTQHQLAKRPDVMKPSKIQAIFITHLHGDHCFGLPGLLASLSLSGVLKSLTLVGPEGLKEMVETNLKLSATYLTYELEMIELEHEVVKDLGVFKGCNVTAFPMRHKVPCFGYYFKDPPTAGSLDAKKAMSLGAKGKDLGLLKGGKDVTLPNGTIIKASDVVGEEKPGASVAALGDTSNSDNMLEIAKGVDLLVHEATLDADEEEKAILGGHSTSRMAGEFAKRLAAKRLVISHFSKRYYEGSSKKEGEKNIDSLQQEATEAFGNDVVAADDFMIVNVRA
eukprot:TRINITY_DN12264_c1_g1_i1.p1 TRINITY_DN12264_c1_g1~~TRINITY_DN12264_c1_g1_i1.p1  ORF type:complete len:327 (-),score=66.59 TRINITY_DN12264_c1_g1_i1:99-1055(-)